MTNIYTLIAYKPGESGWHDRCGDYHSGNDSELNIHYFNEAKNAGKWWARSQFEDSNREHTLLINGVNPGDSCTVPDDKISLYDSIYIEIDDFRFQEYETLKKIREEALESEKIKKQKAEEIRQLTLKKEIETKEREQLALLINKYGK